MLVLPCIQACGLRLLLRSWCFYLHHLNKCETLDARFAVRILTAIVFGNIPIFLIIFRTLNSN
jgi:hypothetical protein